MNIKRKSLNEQNKYLTLTSEKYFACRILLACLFICLTGLAIISICHNTFHRKLYTMYSYTNTRFLLRVTNARQSGYNDGHVCLRETETAAIISIHIEMLFNNTLIPNKSEMLYCASHHRMERQQNENEHNQSAMWTEQVTARCVTTTISFRVCMHYVYVYYSHERFSQKSFEWIQRALKCEQRTIDANWWQRNRSPVRTNEEEEEGKNNLFK